MIPSSFPFSTEEVIEGSITFLVPKLTLFAKGTSEYVPSKAPVFYNPLMELSRDIAVLALRIYQKNENHRIRVCDPLTGCGIRGLRFACEVNGVDLVVLNDLNLQAARLIRINAKKNELEGKVIMENMDARALFGIYALRKGFHAIDIDPFGSPSRFLDSAMIALKNRGLLALTATDTAPLCGVNPKSCIRKYFGKPLRTEYCHELALRLFINSIVLSAARFNLGTNVLFSHSTDHYLRVYVQLIRGAERANESIGNRGYILHCFNCLNRKWIFNREPLVDRECDICKSKMDIAGPLWLGKLVDEDFTRKLFEEAGKISLGTRKRLSRLLSIIGGEVNTPPTYFDIHKICEKLGLSAVSRDRVIEKLETMGYKVVRTHFNSQGIKSDASIQVVKEAVRRSSSSFHPR